MADSHGNLQALVDSLRNSQHTPLTTDEVESVAAATALLERPLDERPIWHAVEQRGLFFVFEGLDRSGKSTQSRRLAAHLEQTGHTVRWMCFPDRHTPVGALINLYLQRKIELSDEAVHRLFSANRWENAQTIVDELNQGTTIICDRYAFSGVAYSAAKGLDVTWCQEPDRGLPAPDGVFLIHIDEKVGASRADFGDERYENADMQAQVRAQFQREELRTGVSWHDVNGAREIEIIHADIREAVQGILTAREEGVLAINGLWVT